MRTIEIDNEVFSTLASRASGFNQTPNDVLRVILDLENKENEVKKPITRTNKGDRDTIKSSLFKVVETAKFVSSNGMKRYLLILSAIYKDNKEKFVEITDFQYGDRKHFANSIEEIENSGKNTAPQLIPDSPFAALTNLSAKRKRKILEDIMRFLGYHTSIIERITSTMPEPKSRNSRLSKR